MTQLKTVVNDASVKSFLDSVADTDRKADCEEVLGMMQKATGEPPRMWGKSIVGFGSYHYKYASGREGDWMLCGFSPRKRNLTIYIMPGFSNYARLMKKLGKHTTGKSCLYVTRLDEIDRDVLRELINKSVADMKSMYPSGA